MKAKVEVNSFTRNEEASEWLESFLHREDIKVFHILQSESANSNEHGDFFNMTFTVVYAEMVTAENLSDKIKEAQEATAQAAKNEEA